MAIRTIEMAALIPLTLNMARGTITILLATTITAIVSLTTTITTTALIIATISHMEPFVMILSVKGQLKVKEKLWKYLTHLST